MKSFTESFSLGSRKGGCNPSHRTGPGAAQMPGKSGRPAFAEGSCKGLREHPDREEGRQTTLRSPISNPPVLPDHQRPYAGPPSSRRRGSAILAEKREDVNVLRVGMACPGCTRQRGSWLAQVTFFRTCVEVCGCKATWSSVGNLLLNVSPMPGSRITKRMCCVRWAAAGELQPPRPPDRGTTPTRASCSTSSR